VCKVMNITSKMIYHRVRLSEHALLFNVLSWPWITAGFVP